MKKLALSRLITPTMLLPGFSVKHFLKRVVITPIGFEDKIFKLKRFSGFSVKHFLKRVAGKHYFKRVALKHYFKRPAIDLS
ncbi:hypothetical protein [Methanosarcina barkeri]|uniref:hypothetical protein n=1 Tax=Methanosarcina barkeri TaxID=2208 RepID=UPI0012D43C73|nr:hypothetical protein [Methanosarcina barkeri]